MKPLDFDSDLQLLKSLTRDFRKLGYRRRKRGKDQSWRFWQENGNNWFTLTYTPLLRNICGAFFVTYIAYPSEYEQIKEILDFWMGEDSWPAA